MDVPADHWALLATAKLLSLTDNGKELFFSEKVLVQHAAQICERILREQQLHTSNPLLLGGFSADGKTTPTATRLEGLLAVMTFLPQGQEYNNLRMRIRQSIDRGMGFLMRSRIPSGPFAGAIPRVAIDYPLNNHARHPRSTEVRIDYVQHAMCAMLQFNSLFNTQE